MSHASVEMRTMNEPITATRDANTGSTKPQRYFAFVQFSHLTKSFALGVIVEVTNDEMAAKCNAVLDRMVARVQSYENLILEGRAVQPLTDEIVVRDVSDVEAIMDQAVVVDAQGHTHYPLSRKW